MAGLRRTQIPTLDGIVREIYASLSEDMSFERSLGTLGGAFRSHICALHAEDMRTHHAGLELFGPLQALELSSFSEAYSTRWAGQNLWMERSAAGFLSKGYEYGEAVVSDSELTRAPYYRFFLKPLDIRHGVGINVRSDGASIFSILSLNRSAKAGPFSRNELLMIETLRPHLVNAYSIYRRLTALQDAAISLRETFDRAPIGMLVLDAGGKVVEQNAEASRLLATHAGISCAVDHTLRLTCPSTRAKLRDALSRLGGACAAPMPECLVIGRTGECGAGSLVLHLCAFPAPVSQVMVRNGRILGFLCELSRHSEGAFGHHVLQSALNLTPMEAKVVMSLREHNDPMRVALHLGLAISTVRTHLKHVFYKTGTTRQSELLRLADRLLSVAPH